VNYRKLSKAQEAENLLCNQLWYGRHCLREIAIAEGRLTLVDEQAYPIDYDNETILRYIWEGAKRSAITVQERYGKENFQPWDDFEWGMINGKLSALRWILGEDWDALYT